MCGFAGLLHGPGRGARDDLSEIAARMAGALRHRGPDDAGVWADPGPGVALGHRRLSIVDLSPEGHQPMVSASGRYVVAFNGEIYNFRELRRELEGLGHRFRGHSDTAVLLAAVEQWGVRAAVERFGGMFAFALWDRESETLALCRDRLGEKPLYYGWLGGRLVFGSELKALERHPEWTGEIDRTALAQYMRYAYVPSPRSIYRGIHKLPPGTLLRVPRGAAEARPEPYWSVEEVADAGARDPFRGGETAAVDELEALIGASVGRQMVADVPLGAFLSGGVDSSAVVALMQARAERPVRTFTIGFDERGFDEAPYAREVARHLGTEHTEHRATAAEAREVIHRLPAMYDEPFADASQIPTWLVSSVARRQVTVALSGDGGDELFGGYNRHVWGRRIRSRTRWIPAPLRRAAGRGITALPPATWERVGALAGQPQLADRAAKLAAGLGAATPAELYEAVVRNWEPGWVVLGQSGTGAGIAGGAPRAGGDVAEWMMRRDMTGYLPDGVLAKVDRAAMAVSLETRVPLLDPAVVAFAWRLPLEMKIRGGVGKWALRQVLYRHVPERLIDRPKMGFGVPVGSWLRGPLRAWAEELLDERTLRADGYLNPEPVRARWRQHLRGRGNHAQALWTVLMFQAWLHQGGRSVQSNQNETSGNLLREEVG